MRTIFLLAAGMYLGRQLFLNSGQKQAEASKAQARAKLRRFLRENLPAMSATDITRETERILS